MTIKRLLAIALIFAATTAGWFILGASLAQRSGERDSSLGAEVSGGWGPAMDQPHPVVYYTSPASSDGKKRLPPATSKINVALSYEPKKKGLPSVPHLSRGFSG